MPRGDRTGPNGMGPMTGRMAGYCADYQRPGFASLQFRSGFGGGGRGYRNMFYATGLPGWARYGFYPGWAGAGPEMDPQSYSLSPEQRKEILKNQAQVLKQQVQELEKEISKLEED